MTRSLEIEQLTACQVDKDGANIRLAGHDGSAILSLATPDGYAVSFSIPPDVLGRLASQCQAAIAAIREPARLVN